MTHPPRPTATTGTVLVVDDDRAARDVMASALMKEGYRVISAAGGRDGLRLARERRPDAIVLDIIMPDLDGWAVLRSLKADAELCDIPVILATMLGDRDMGVALGAAEHLTKPIDAQELLRVLAADATGRRTTRPTSWSSTTIRRRARCCGASL